MEATIVKFLEMQGLEAEAEKAREEMESLPEGMAALDSSLGGLRQGLEDLRAEAAKTKEQIRITELDLAKLKALNESNVVRGKKSRNQREYMAFEKDQKTIETKTQEAEDRYLQDSARLEELELRLGELEAAFPGKEEAILRERAELAARLGAATAKAAKLAAEREGILGGLPEASVARYRKASDGRPGRALAPVDDSTCLACRMNIPPQLYNELHKNDKLMLCPHCHRIMYIRKNPAFGYVPPEAPEPQPAKKPARGPKKRAAKAKGDLGQNEASC
jgi:predicted  nucleic acid-binding Zn-ribbon protein